jgi:tetratricopeptide (TPR) repeat protein
MNQKSQKPIINARLLSAAAYLRKLNRLPKNDPLRGNILITLGWIFDQRALKSKLRKRLQRRAKFYFRQALRYKQNKREALRGLATVLMHEGHYKRALALYQKAHSIKRDADTFNDLGNIFRKMGRVEQALQYYKKSLMAAKKTRNDFLVEIAKKNLALLGKSRRASLSTNRERL